MCFTHYLQNCFFTLQQPREWMPWKHQLETNHIQAEQSANCVQNSRGAVKSMVWCQYIMYSYYNSQLLAILIQRTASRNVFYWSGNSDALVINVPCVVNMCVNQYVLVLFDEKMSMIYIYINFRVHLLAWLLLWVLSTTQGHKIVANGCLCCWWLTGMWITL